MSCLSLSILLDKLTAALKNADSPLVPFLKPGISKEYIDLIAKGIYLSLPEELYIYFGWHDGIIIDNNEDYPLSTFSLFTLASPVSIVDSFEIYKYNSVDFSYWDRKYFPIFESGLGDYFLIDIDEKSPTYKMIMLYSPINPYFEGVISKADSLDHLIETLLECYQKRIYYFELKDGLKLFRANPKLEINEWVLNNPKSEYWKVLEKFR